MQRFANEIRSRGPELIRKIGQVRSSRTMELDDNFFSLFYATFHPTPVLPIRRNSSSM